MRVEYFAASLPQQGRTQNEDAFLMERGERPFAALCDGAGNAERAAKRVLDYAFLCYVPSLRVCVRIQSVLPVAPPVRNWALMPPIPFLLYLADSCYSP